MKRFMSYVVLVALGVSLGWPGAAMAAKDTQVGVADQVFAMMAAEGGWRKYSSVNWPRTMPPAPR